MSLKRLFIFGAAVLLFSVLPDDATARDKWTTEAVLHRVLDRSTAWNSLHAEFKVRVSVGDTIVSARGRLSYVAGERMEIAFRKPWSRFFGSFYIMPGRLIYWDDNISQVVFDSTAELHLSSVIPLPFPDWDVRDMLPLAVSGREKGFQPDTAFQDGDVMKVEGRCLRSRHDLWLDLERGTVLREVVQRERRETITKEYRRSKSLYGWSVPVRVVCTDATGHFRVDWSLSKLDFNAFEFTIPPTAGISNVPSIRN